jgi:acyl-CoA synthetase (AMP-forming)/AMP-acid ligase II/thioesterase domain-containing protein
MGVATIPSRPSAVAAGIARLAATDPDRLSLATPTRSLTIGELHVRSASFAAQLAERLGPTPATPWLPVVIDRSVDSAIALHAAIMTGLPFAPIDASFPSERIADLLSLLGGPQVVAVSHLGLSDLVPHDVAAISPDGRDASAVHPAAVEPDGPGMVVFTSGSTGRPKAVVRRWSSLESSMEHLHVRVDQPGVLRVGLLRPFSFAAGLNYLGVMATGDSVHLANPAVLDALELMAWLDEQEVGSIVLGAAVATTLLNASGGRRLLPHLRTIGMGGQSAGWELVEPLRRLASPELTVVSSFAATEFGGVISYSVGPDHPIGTGTLPLGTPLDDRRVRLEPIDGPGSPLELLGGHPAALEYLGEPDLTAKRFLTDADGMSWWRSGDLVDVDEGGVFHHRGRVDDMVKINGFRVEPAETEAALRVLPGLGNVAVLAHDTTTGAKRLVAHLEVDDPMLTPEAVRAHLDARLPSHQVPAILMRHERLAINDRGKVDRAALRDAPLEPWRSNPIRHTSVELNSWLSGHVASMLDLSEVGPDDDLWHLGLDSLGAVELCTWIADAGFRDLSPPMLLEHRTPEALASFLASERPHHRSSTVELNAGGQRPPIFVYPGAGGTALAFRDLASHLGQDQPLVVLEPQGMHQRGPIERTVTQRVDHALDQVRRLADPTAPLVLIGYSGGGTPAFETARRLHRSGRPVHLVLLDAAPGTNGHTSVPPVGRRIRNKGLLGTLRALPAALTRRRHILWPGRPSYQPWRYDAFRTIAMRANASYTPEPLDIPATLIRATHSTIDQRCHPLLPQLQVHDSTGGHLSMLSQPHVVDLARVIQHLIERSDQTAS